MLSRKWSRNRIAALTFASFALVAFIAAGCGDDDEDGTPTQAASTPAATAPASTPTTAAAAPTTAATAAATAATDATPAAGATVSMGTAGLVDSRGFSLYLFANDVADSGTSACSGGCIAAWPALTAEGALTAGAGVTGELGTITRDDGTVQVTYKGLPLYFFANDKAAGDTNGKDIPNWSLAQP
ncbi:MAG: hypothetical protein HY873_03085 [Chloroflexi bacterium]|nr:hypothetical protein [Chloroflexota bacterium]